MLTGGTITHREILRIDAAERPATARQAAVVEDVRDLSWGPGDQSNREKAHTGF